MPNNSGRAWLTILILFFIVVVVVYVVMMVPQAQPVKDYIVSLYSGFTGSTTTEEPITQIPEKQPAVTPSQQLNPAGQTTIPPAGEQPTQPPAAQGGTPPAAGSLTQPQTGSFPVAGILNSLGIGGAASTEAAKPEQDKSDNSPVAILQSCMTKLKSRDIIGAEAYISDNGKKYTVNGMTGIHKLLLKNVIDTHAFDEIGYNDTKITGQTAWVPIYSKLDTKNKIVSLYIILANRGDGWKVDDLYDPRR